MMRIVQEDEEKVGLLGTEDNTLWQEDDEGVFRARRNIAPRKPWMRDFSGFLSTCRRRITRTIPTHRKLLEQSLDSPIDPPSKRSRTAWMDGLRGFAALLVFWHHHVLWAHNTLEQGEIFENAFGYKQRNYFAALPGIRTFFTGGHYSVAVFFVISGYVLTAKPLSLIQEGDFAKLADNLGSALFRRWLRLHLPLMITTFIFFTSWHVFGIWVNAQYPSPTYFQEIQHWFIEYRFFSFVFGQGFAPWISYNFHSWSIPAEMRGSIVVYTTLLAFARLTNHWRLAGQCALTFYFMCVTDAWYLSLFVSGMTLSDLDIQALNEELPSFITRLKKYRTIIFLLMLSLGIYLGGVPSHSTELKFLSVNPGWYYLSWLNPNPAADCKWWYLFWAATLTVASIQRLPVKRFFETRFCQYLGRISYSLYLVHGPLLWTVGDRLYAAVGWYTETHKQNIPEWVDKVPLVQAGPLGLEVAFLLPCVLIMFPLTLWVAEVTTDLIDTPSVRFAQKLYSRACGKPCGKPSA